MIYHFFHHVRKKLDERRGELVTALVSGTIHSMEDYKFLTGKLRGIEESVSLLSEAYRILADSTDKDEAYAESE